MQYFTGRKKFFCEIVIFSRYVMVIKTNFHPRFLLISLKKGHYSKLLPGNALFILKMQGSLKKKGQSRCSLKKKKVFTSISSLISLFPSQNQCVLEKKKKKKVFTSISSLISLFFSSFASPNIHYWSSLQTSLRFLIFRPKFTIFSKITKKKRVFISDRPQISSRTCNISR